MQTAGDHQVNREPEIAVETERDAFADATHLAHDATFDARERRVRRSQEKRAALETHAFERLTDDTGLERGDVRGNVRQLGHSTHLRQPFDMLRVTERDLGRLGVGEAVEERYGDGEQVAFGGREG